MKLTTLWTLALLAACAKQPAEPEVTATSAVATPTGSLTPTPPATASAPSEQGEAARWSKLAYRLRVRDASDLPDHAALAAIPDAAEGLVWLASNDPALFVRARALDAVGVLGAPGAVDVLSAAVVDASLASNVRAGAVLGLGRLGEPARAVLLTVVEDADLRIAGEAVGVLARDPGARDALREVALKPELAAEIRTKIAAIE